MLYEGSVVKPLRGMKGSTNALLSHIENDPLGLLPVSGIIHLFKM